MGKRRRNGFKSGERKRVLVFDEESRREFLTGFHKRKVERRKKALEEIKTKLKEEQRKMKEERHKEYMKMLKERQEALEEADELDHLVTSKMESIQYDHPGHTVTVTTVSNLDLTGAKWLTPGTNEAEDEAAPSKGGNDEDENSSEKHVGSLPKKANNPLLSKRISSLNATLHARSKKKLKGKKLKPFQDKKQSVQKVKTGKTSRSQRRRRAGNSTRNMD